MDKLQNLDWSLVQAFLAVVETGSLSAAARHLQASQPTIGRQIHALEAALDITLFDRQPKGMAPTEAGLALLPPAMAMRDASMRLRLAAAGEAEDLSGTVRLTASVFFSHYILPPLVADLRTEAPEIQIELVASDTSENLLFREADIALRMYRPEQLDMITQHLGNVPLGIFAAKKYLARKGRPTRPEELQDHDMVGYDASDLILKGMRTHGVPAEQDWFATRCDHQTSYWQLVRAGCGIGFCQRPIALADQCVEEIDLGLNLPVLPVWLTTHPRLRRTPRVRRVWDHLRQHLPPLLDPDGSIR